MYKPTKKLVVPSKFSFPFNPYEIQLDFMTNLYKVIENGEIGIFESPTGTGKSLSLTCGSLTWLQDYEKLIYEDLSERIVACEKEIKQLDSENAKSTDWITGQAESIEKKDELAGCKTIKVLIDNYHKKLDELRKKIVEKKDKRSKNYRKKNESIFDEHLENLEKNDDDEFMINEIEDDENVEEDNHQELKYKCTQIIYCSRTHSQLSQVVNEVKGTSFGKSIRLTSLASRQNYCINSNVKCLKSGSLINEKCLEMQKKSSKATFKDMDKNITKKRKTNSNGKCQFYNKNAIESMKNDLLFDIMDIEELVNYGKQEKGCPYYTARAAIEDSQLVMVPYQTLLHKKTRQQSGLDIKNSVIIIDEAHNLMDTISSIHSAEISSSQLKQGVDQLEKYHKKYMSHIATHNILKIKQLIFICKRLIKVLDNDNLPSNLLSTIELRTEGEFLVQNIPEILKFCEDNRLAEKVHGFAQRLQIQESKVQKPKISTKDFLKALEEQKSNKNKKKVAEEEDVKEEKAQFENSPNVVRPILAFLDCLTEIFEDGRILINRNLIDIEKSTMKYMLLNPSSRFNEIIQETRSIILAGGTMKPIEELTDQLFKNCPERVKVHTYRHVVAKDAILPIALAKGPSGKEMLFNFDNRGNANTFNELSSCIQNFCFVVPNGIVVFFCSYDYLAAFYDHLKQSKKLEIIEKRKKIFKEPRTSGNVDKILTEYAEAAKSGSGALMLSVVGGKLSEGLNFSDELGRCVVVVGLPYPNKNSPELKERMRYLDKTVNPRAGDEYYLNLCMKAVNQCIGRAVRHINDYAAVILLDVRYTRSCKVKEKLPIWISEGMQCVDAYGGAHGGLVKFFKDKKNKVLSM